MKVGAKREIKPASFVVQGVTSDCISHLTATISERQKEVESFLAEGGEGENTKTEDSFAELEVDNLGEVEEDKGEGRREGSDSNDGSDKEP